MRNKDVANGWADAMLSSAGSRRSAIRLWIWSLLLASVLLVLTGALLPGWSWNEFIGGPAGLVGMGLVLAVTLAIDVAVARRVARRAGHDARQDSHHQP